MAMLCFCKQSCSHCLRFHSSVFAKYFETLRRETLQYSKYLPNLLWSEVILPSQAERSKIWLKNKLQKKIQQKSNWRLLNSFLFIYGEGSVYLFQNAWLPGPHAHPHPGLEWRWETPAAGNGLRTRSGSSLHRASSLSVLLVHHRFLSLFALFMSLGAFAFTQH